MHNRARIASALRVESRVTRILIDESYTLYDSRRFVIESLRFGLWSLFGAALFILALSRRAEGEELRAAEAGGKNSRRAAAGSEL